MATEKLTNEQKEARRQTAQDHSRKIRDNFDKAKQKLSKELVLFMGTFRRGEGADSELAEKLRQGLISGKYKKPSEFAEQELSPLFGTLIPEALVKSLLYELDNIRSYPYTDGWYRRSFRSGRYEDYIHKICTVVHNYSSDDYDAPYHDYVTGKVSEEQLASFYVYPNAHNPYDIAYHIDTGDKETVEYITSFISGGIPDEITHAMLRGIFMSRNSELHTLAGKLLLAAKLQEGLRQAIAETCDEGTFEAFRYMIGVIADNDLIRFSSVKRAVGTWTGLMPEGIKDLDRISGKTLSLIISCLDDVQKRSECLASEDAMQIYIALWAEAVTDARAAEDSIVKLADKGSHQQALVSAFFIRELFSDDLKSELSKKFVLTRSEDNDIMAITAGMLFMNKPFIGVLSEIPKNSFSDYFADKAEAEALYSALLPVMEKLPKKALEFSPCVFPWNSEKLSRGDIIRKLIIIAAMLEDNDKKDFLCPLLGEVEVSSSSSRSKELELLLCDPQTELQLDTLVAEIADKESYTRKRAFEIAKNRDLAPKHYLMLEDMLRYKAADMRENVLSLLIGMEDDALFSCTERLISDKKEEKRTAGLDIIMQLQNSDRKALYERCLPLTAKITAPTTKEQILIDQLRPGVETSGTDNVHSLYSEEDTYTPVLDESYISDCSKTFEKYFPSSQLIGSGKGSPDTRFMELLKALDALIEEHKNEEFTDVFGEKLLLGSSEGTLRTNLPDGTQAMPFAEMWDKFYEENIKDSVTLRRMMLGYVKYRTMFSDTADRLFGSEFSEKPVIVHESRIRNIFGYLESRLDTEAEEKLVFAMRYRLLKLSETADLYVPDPETPNPGYWRAKYYYVKDGEIRSTESRINEMLKEPRISDIDDIVLTQRSKRFDQFFALSYMLADKLGRFILNASDDDMISDYYIRCVDDAPASCYIRAAYEGIITERYMYRHLFEKCADFGTVIQELCGIARDVNDCDRKRMTRRAYNGWRSYRALSDLLGMNKAVLTDENRPVADFAVKVYKTVIGMILDSELKRGDTSAEFSKYIGSVSRIFGADRFVQILSALGRDTLERSGGYSSEISKRKSLSMLLGVCVPREDDTAEKLGELLKGTDITEKRLVEAALFSPEWIPVVGRHLGWEGFESACYYFIAHMNENFSEVQKAVFAKYTPIPTEELAVGAFDINWFREASEAVGEKRFDMIYTAAKYITDGAKHSRARKYADAVRGKLDLDEAEKQITEKRNKDTLMAAALVPIKDEDDILRRYKLFNRFKKEASAFGAQRKASETAAADMALRNLSENAGFTDVTRLTLRMETKLFDDIRPLTQPQTLDDLTLRLAIDEHGKCEIECIKGGKALKSVPAKYKKNDLVLTLTETKKQLTEQYRRTRVMFEQAMEDSTAFTVGEINDLRSNPVTEPVIRDLVFKVQDNGKLGFMDNNCSLSDQTGICEEKMKKDRLVTVAHPLDMYLDGHWKFYQQYLFGKGIVQPFKQVFRELYIKTDDERGAMTSLRYAGNQIQPKKTAACLKSRRWVADVEDGLQKVYYKENIIARIYALADWFSPADIEAPTLEWVDFFDRKTGKQKKIDDIPDIIFSEVMRDVDLAVSVAHAGGVDPEASHSTVEMRRAVCEFTLPLFGLTNVTFEKNHAFIKGSLADYSIHLGSGAVHIQGGSMINLLPVHSQHRGRLFLPFVDDDPKTAQIISEILLFADDKSIKDPFILSQIKA